MVDFYGFSSFTASQRILVIGYGASVLLFLVYFLWEDGPFHYSRRVESFYIIFALTLAYLAPLSAFSTALNPNQEVMLAFRGIMRFVLMFHILRQMVLPHPHPRFLEGAGGTSRAVTKAVTAASPGACAAFRRGLMTPSPSVRDPSVKVKRLVRELDTKITRAVSRSSATATGLIGEKYLGPLLWFLLMCYELAFQIGFLTRMHSVFVWSELALVLVVIALEFSRCKQVGSDQAQIHELLASQVQAKQRAPSAAHQCESDLLHLLANISVGSLFEVAHRDTVRLLTDVAFDQGLLCPTSKAIIVHALQQRGLRHSASSQRVVVKLIMSCRGTELTTLKNILDSSGSYLNLHKLVYEDVTVKKRATILEHLKFEAHEVRKGRAGFKAVGVKLLSDVDDTLYSSGGRFPAGCDARFPKHMVYPGCLRLFKAICQAREASDEAPIDGPSCDLVFLSARPHVYKDLMEDYCYRLFRDLVEDGRMHAFPTLLPGRLKSSVGAMLSTPFMGSRAWKHVAETKYNTFASFQELYLEYDFVFCGDNGQGDLLAAQLMCEDGAEAESPSAADDLAQNSAFTFAGLTRRVSDTISSTRSGGVASQRPGLLFALIHEVKPEAQAMAREDPAERGDLWRSSLENSGVLLHRSYVGAAVALHQRGGESLMPLELLAEVANEAVDELTAAQEAQSEWDWTGGAFEAVQKDLLRAVELVQAAGLPPLRSLPSLPQPTHRAPSVFSRASKRRVTLPGRPGSWAKKAPKEPTAETGVSRDPEADLETGAGANVTQPSWLLGRMVTRDSSKKHEASECTPASGATVSTSLASV
jgi:hypothetical protein